MFEALQDALRGYCVTTATPFSTDLSQVDINGISTNMSHLKKNGVRLVIPCGNTGEFYSLSEAEWGQVVKATTEACSGKMLVMPGVGNSVTTAISMTKHAESMGAEGVMILYPQHVFSSEEGIVGYYRRILDAAKIGVTLYKRGPLLTDAVLKELINHRNVVGVKYAFGRVVDFAYSIQTLGKRVIWSCGTAERFAPFFWLAGAEGFTTGLGNFAPRVSQRMFDALKRNDYAEAMKVHALITPFENLREGKATANNVPVVKAMMDYLGLVGGECRPPIQSLTAAERKAAVDAVSTWGLK
ncbi:MAG: dihydrodipicolinate synthase family protein [Candidatus Thorarchaeota archaeon]|nr:MAG: dihydrodipicolinate synthase family protein [Candidatus Thorarchaeota archaeon]